MELFLEGLLIGATLTVMIGPITFTILDASFTGGSIFGIVTAFGMWCSDAMYIALCYFGAHQLKASLQSPLTAQWTGIIGGIILLTLGYIIWRTRKKQVSVRSPNRILHFSGYWLRGFMVNTFAPFSLLFWPTVTLAIVVPRADSVPTALAFYGGVMVSIVSGDTLKAFFSGWIRRKISSGILISIRAGLAALFVVAGLFFIGRVVWESV